MSIDTRRHLTADGYNYTVIATDLPGDRPYLIYVPELDQTFRLDRNLRCAENEGVSLTDKRNCNTRFFNVYRAADGSFVIGKRAFKTDDDRRLTRDSRRALFGLRIAFDENMDAVTAERV